MTQQSHNPTCQPVFRRFSFLFLGIGSLAWFLIRVIPKPSRAAYPCMRVAAPFASTFVLWLLGAGTSLMFFRRARGHVRQARYLLAAITIVAGGIAGSMLISPSHSPASAAARAATPLGDAKGANPGRVVWVHDSSATNWGGLGDGHWWEPDHTDQSAVDRMLSRAVRALSGDASDARAWDTLFRYFNRIHGRGAAGYSKGEKIAIKTNLTFCNYFPAYCCVDSQTYSLVKKMDYMNTSPQMVRALLRQLVNVVGVDEADISVGDPVALYPNEFYDSCHAEFPNVKYIDHAGKFGRTRVEFSAVPVYWSCRPAGVRQDYVPRHYAEATYLINLSNMKAHPFNGITLGAKNHFGSLIRLPDDSGYYNLHQSLPYAASQSGAYRVLVDLMGHAHLGGKTVLNIVDGLYAGTHNSDTVPRRFSAAPFNGKWTSSVFASQDPVAIESVLFDLFQLDDDPKQYPKMPGVEDYLSEAAQADNPPSGVFYDPDHAAPTTRLASLGVFEHWSNAVDREYSRNLGTGNGIELVFIDGVANRTLKRDRPVNRQSEYTLRPRDGSGLVEFTLPRSDDIRLTLFDARGRMIETVLSGGMAAGTFQADVLHVSSGNRMPAPGFYGLVLARTSKGVSLPVAKTSIEVLGR
jgi:uncharacterized protein (DUF362 family)